MYSTSQSFLESSRVFRRFPGSSIICGHDMSQDMRRMSFLRFMNPIKLCKQVTLLQHLWGIVFPTCFRYDVTMPRPLVPQKARSTSLTLGLLPSPRIFIDQYLNNMIPTHSKASAGMLHCKYIDSQEATVVSAFSTSSTSLASY